MQDLAPEVRVESLTGQIWHITCFFFDDLRDFGCEEQIGVLDY